MVPQLTPSAAYGPPLKKILWRPCLANTLLKDESARDNHVFPCNFAKCSPIVTISPSVTIITILPHFCVTKCNEFAPRVPHSGTKCELDRSLLYFYWASTGPSRNSNSTRQFSQSGSGYRGIVSIPSCTTLTSVFTIKARVKTQRPTPV